MGKKAVRVPIAEQLLKVFDKQSFNDDEVFIGIDPGIEGAISLMRLRPNGRMHLSIFDIPVSKEVRVASSEAIKARRKQAEKKKQKKAVSRTTTRSIYNFEELAQFFKSLGTFIPAHRVHVLIEKVVVSLYRPGAKRCFTCKRQFGQSPYTGIAVGIANGMWPMYFHALGWKFNFVDSQKWKKAFGLTRKDKAVSRSVASSLFKRYNDYFVRVKDHNRAEAAILSVYAWKHRDEVFNAHVSAGGEEG